MSPALNNGGPQKEIILDASVYCEVLRPANRQDLEGASPEAAAIITEMVPGGYVAAADLKGRPGGRAAISPGCANGLLRKGAGGVLELGTVRSWLSHWARPRPPGWPGRAERGTRTPPRWAPPTGG